MSVKKFKFVSPGVFVNEIDNSQLTKQGDDIGPVIIGTALRGPSMVPTRIESFSDFVETFGEPLSGSEGSDVWREGNKLAPTYAAYAAQAYLRNASPITFVRLLGEAHPDGSDKAGWSIADPNATFDSTSNAAGAYGLFVANGYGSAVQAKAELIFKNVVASNAGFTLAIGADTSEAGSGKTLTEASADHRAVAFTVANPAATGGAFDTAIETITIGGIGGSGSRIYTVGFAGDGGTITVSNGNAVELIAEQIASAINAADGEVLEATANVGGGNRGATVIVRQKTRGGTALTIAVSAGGNIVKHASDGIGHVNPFSVAGTTSGTATATTSFITTGFDGDDGNFVATDNMSIAKACEDAGIEPQALAAGNSAVDAKLAESIANVIDNSGAGGSYDANSDGDEVTGYQASAAADGLNQKITITTGATGAGAADLAGDKGNTATTAVHDVTLSVQAIGTKGTGNTNFLGGVDQDSTMNAALAAIIYAKSGAVSLLGESVSDATKKLDAINGWVKSDGANNQFKLRARNTASDASDVTNKEDIAFNFSKNSRLYIRNVLNTNPTLCDANVSGSSKLKAYFLGETFDRHLAEVQSTLNSTTAKGAQFACLVPLSGAGVQEANGSAALTPWIISQHNGAPADLDTTNSALLASGNIESKGVEKLLRFHSLYAGQWERKNLKIAIEDVKAPSDKFNPYGTFSVVVRRVEDSDAAPIIAERFSSCNLNPASADYVGKKIGDMNMVWDDDERRYQSHGQFENQSRFMRVEVSSSVESGQADPRMLPFGFLGPRKRQDVTFDNNGGAGTLTGAAASKLLQAASSGVKFVGSTAQTAAADYLTLGPQSGGADNTTSNAAFVAVLKFPEMALRITSADSTLSSPRDANFGISTSERGSDSIFDDSYMDLAGFCGHGITSVSTDASDASGSADQHQFIFTLDDIRYAVGQAEGGPESDPNAVSTPPKNYVWEAGSRASSGASTYASITGYTPASGIPGGFEAILDKGIRSFTLPLLGGHDGVDIFQVTPFAYHADAGANTALASADSSALSHYALNSLKKAVDTVADPEAVDMNLLAAPGMTHPSITSHMVSVCESRGDALAVIDLDNDYMPMGMDVAKSEADRMPNVDKAITSLRERSLNSSYGCAFFPWVQIADTMSGRVLWAPPSIAALGTMASSSRKSELWFAPAGFTRGGLTDGAAGVPVSSVRLRLNSKERDKLYEANINPIAQFPAEGIVIFGQKTLQVTPSALDRINVRRLMIFLKKSISRMAKTVLFDQNVESTWSRFTSQADPFLASVKSRFGLSEYRIILDKTTTTAELVDRNIMYAKILLKPTRAIEYIAIDFVITDSGASFDD